MVINNEVYTQGDVVNVSPAAFQTAYFTASQPGTDEIDVVAFDSIGNSSNLASTTITVGATSPPPPPGSSDLKISTASLISSNLVAGGGGTVALSVTNLGADSAPNTALTQLYLSTNTTLDSSDILVSPGAISDAGLAAGASQSETLSFTLPSNIAGSHYLIAFAGDSDQVANGAAAGDTYAIPITVAATAPSPPPPPPPPPPPSGPSPISIATDATITTRVGSEPVITSGALLAIDTQFSNAADLQYTIVTPPAYGHLIDDFYTTSTFTQADIDNELVDYVQNGTATKSDSFSFYVSDPAGYRSSVETFTFKILPALSPPPPPPPQPPNVTIALANDTGLPTEGGPAFSTSDATLTGTASPGGTVTLTDGSTALGSAVADAAGNWSFSPGSGFAQGGHYITASETNASGQTGTGYLSFDYDTIAPPAPSAPQLALGGNVADTANPTFSGTAEANDEVLLLEGNTVIGTGTATSNGAWDIETGPLGLGYDSITAESIDAAGNISPLSGTDTIEVVPPPPGEVTLNDAAMIGAGDLTAVGTVSDQAGSITEYGPIAADGFTLTNLSRADFLFISWSSGWAEVHTVDNTAQYYDGQDVLIVPTDGIVASGQPYVNVASAPADTIDLKRADGAAFSLVSIDIGPTGDYPTFAVFTGTTAAGQTIKETVELNLPQNSPLQPVALTGFNDVTDVKFTEHFGNGGDPTSIEFDNIVVGSAMPPPPPPAPTPLSAPVTLNDAAMVNAGELPLVSIDDNVFSQSSYYDYGPITASGFAITNLDRSDFAFSSSDSNFANVNGYFYDGPDVLTIPVGQDSVAPSTVSVRRQDGSAFAIQSIKLDTPFAEAATATFTGTTRSGGTVTETFQLDQVQGMQTFQFGSQFDDLTSLQFSGNAQLQAQLQFDDIVLAPPVPDIPASIELSPSSDSGVHGDDITNVLTPEITGTGDAGDTVSLFDGAAVVGTGTVGANGSWAITTTALVDGGHNLTAAETDAAGNPSNVSASLALDVDTTPPAVSFAAASFSSGTVATLSGTSSDNVGVAGVEIFDGATDLGEATLDVATGAWSFTTTLAAGTYSTLTAVATDDAGNVATTTAPFTLATGITGQPYSADEQDYSASGVLIGTDYFYTGVTGRSYTAYEDEDNGSGDLTRVDYTGITNEPYSSCALTYIGALLASSSYDYTSVPAGSPYSSYEKDYNYAHDYVGEDLFYTGITGQSYTGEVQDKNASDHVWREAFTGVTGQPYTSMADRFNASGAMTLVTYDYTGVTGQSYYADQIHEKPNGPKLTMTEDLDSGGYEIIGYAANLHFFLYHGDATITGGGSGETFVLKTIFGADTITDFASYDSGSAHDTISLSKADFANFAALTAGAANVGSNVVITAADGQTLTLDGLNTATLAGLSADFKFHR